MKIVVLGAGAVGGYFGARLLEAGRDVRFLVREARAAALRERGLHVKSPHGDVDISRPPVLTRDEIKAPADVVILSCKAYDLDSALETITPAVGRDTMILPLLNGMGHLDAIAARFGESAPLGGLCMIAATLGEQGEIIHLNDAHVLAFGERAGGSSARMERLTPVLLGAKFKARPSDDILQEMWEKWDFLAALAAATTLMRASVGDIVAAPGGHRFLTGLLGECDSIAAAAGHAARPAAKANMTDMITAKGSAMTASMFRDVQRGGPTEADHVIGDLIRRGKAAGLAVPLLETAYIGLKAHDNQRARVAKA
jgi:2-dehydropantoate 2-reductase